MKYPQSLFTKKIKELISTKVGKIIDAPCGSGETTYELAQYFPNAKLLGADISEKNIKNAKKNYSTANLTFQQIEIHELIEETEKIEVFCLINSLFLLPQPEDLLKKISQKMNEKARLFLILPNPVSTNFKRFQKIAPEVNTFILERKDYDNFFKRVGLKINSCEGIVRVPIYGRRDTKLLYTIRDRYLFWLESSSKSIDYGYFLISLENL